MFAIIIKHNKSVELCYLALKIWTIFKPYRWQAMALTSKELSFIMIYTFGVGFLLVINGGQSRASV